MNTLNSETFNTVIKILREVIHNEAYPAKGPNAIMQRCFAIRTGVNGLLDHIRSVYSQRLEEMRGNIHLISLTQFSIFLFYRVCSFTWKKTWVTTYTK